MTEQGQARSEFDVKKTVYFGDLAKNVHSILQQHSKEGLWTRVPSRETPSVLIRDWGNMSEHCLVETARFGIMGEMVGLSPAYLRTGQLAATAHDLDKKRQKDLVTEQGLSFASFEQASQESKRHLTELFGEKVAYIAGMVGHECIPQLQEILTKPIGELTDLEKAALVMNYIDNYTINAEWAKPADSVNGKKMNDLDRRMDKNEVNPRYTVLNEEGRNHFGGETSYQAQRRLGHFVENMLAIMIKDKTGQEINPLDLPTLVDSKIREQIDLIELKPQKDLASPSGAN